MFRSRWSTVRALALAGAVLAVAACSDDPERDETTGEFTESGDADVFNIQVGDCFNDVGEGEVTELPVVPCTEPHDNEVFHAFNVPGDTFPGDFTAITEEQCFPAFQSFVGVAPDQSALYMTTLEPTAGSWAEGDREVLCIIYDTAGQTTGSLQGANR